MVTLPDPINTLAVMVTYHPDHDVVENVKAASALVDHLVVVDNTPGGPPAVLDPTREMEGVEVHAMGRNVGIASALNYGLALSMKGGYAWTLLLDQDTRLLESFFASAQRATRSAGARVGIVGANFVSRWTQAPYVPTGGGVREAAFVVSSGSLLRAECARAVGWFRDDYFIDYVDVEYCLRARRHGFSVVLASEVVMEHGMGNTVENRVLGYTRRIADYPASRHYYMARNLVVTAGGSGKAERAWLRWEAVQRLKFTALTLAMDPGRVQKLTAMLHGYLDGARGRMGAAPVRYVPRSSGHLQEPPGRLNGQSAEAGSNEGGMGPPKRGHRSPPWVRGGTYVHVPYLDQRGAGMQRYVSGIVPALWESGVEFTAVVGEAHGSQTWLERVPHTVLLDEWAARRVPRPMIALARTAWIQFVFPLLAGRDATLLALAHEVAPFPLFRQIAVVHDLTEYKAFARRHDVVARVRNELWRAGLARSAAIIAISEATRRDLAETLGIAGDHVAVVHEGVDRALFSPDNRVEPPDRLFLLYAGTLDPHKNVPFLLGVYTELVNRGLAVDLVLAGRYRQDQGEALAATVPPHLRGNVRWAGFVTDAELAALLTTCAAFVFPSRNEGFGLAVAEAMACGTPVVSSASGSLAEVVGDGGVLLSPDDREGWASTLERVLTDPAYREALSARALVRAEVFSWKGAAEAYRQILCEGRRPVRAPESSVALLSQE